MTDSDSRRSTGVLSVVGLLAIVVSLVMIVMGILHAAPIDGERGADGVVKQNCTIIEDCGCPGEPMIPWYLIIAGCLTIILVLGRFIWQMVREFMILMIITLLSLSEGLC